MINNKLHIYRSSYNEIEIPFLLDNTTGEKTSCMERIDRTEIIFEALKDKNNVITKNVEIINKDEFDDILNSIHTKKYLDYLEQTSLELSKGDYILNDKFSPKYAKNDTPIVHNIYTQALASAATTLEAIKSLCFEQAKFSYAICRPPGHHAGRDFMGGYCYLNNVVIAAKFASKFLNKPVGILDIDYHFGNGTHDILSSDGDKNILFASIHGHTKVNYPYVDEPSCNENMFFINFEELPNKQEYIAAIEKTLDHLKECKLLIISLGYDIIQEDSHGKWSLPFDIYKDVGRVLNETNKPICFVQEGGYCLEKLKDCSTTLYEGLRSYV